MPLYEGTNTISSRDDAAHTAPLHSAIQAAALRSTGSLKLIHSPQYESRYLIIKRVPNSNAARFALAFEIDTLLLFKNDARFWQAGNTEVAVSLPDGDSLSQDTQQSSERSPFVELFEPPTAVNTLQSRTQPLRLFSTVSVSTKDLLPAIPLIIGISIIGLTLLVGAAIIILILASRQAEKRREES